MEGAFEAAGFEAQRPGNRHPRSGSRAAMSTVQAAVEGLAEAVNTPPERNDLGLLARMHSWCQNLVEEGKEQGEQLLGVAERLTTLLERLILDEAADAELGIQLVPNAVAAIEQLYQGADLALDGLLGQMGQAIDGAGGGATDAPAATTSATPEPAAAAAPAEAEPIAAEPTADTETTPAAVAPASAAEAPAEPPASAPAVAAPEPYVSEPLEIDLAEQDHLQGFLDESTEHLDAIEAGLLDLETDPSDAGKINELFRPFHTIKGIAGFLNLRDINRLTHEIETILDLGRKHELKITQDTVDLIFQSVDYLKSQLDQIRRYLASPSGAACPQPDIVDIMARLQVAARPGAAPPTPTPAAERPKLGEVLVDEGTVAEAELTAALDEQSRREPPPPKVGEILVERGSATPDQVDQALIKQASGAPLADQSIRVDTRKLDFLVDAIGELVIAQSMVSLAEVIHTDDKLSRNVSQVSKIVRDVQETAMAMRMVPIGHTFQKMRRLVRDVSRKAQKNVELTISGEETELDKNVIQAISDPLVHLVRNAVDHGIEAPDARQQAGKPEAGRVMLNAYHQGDSIVIEIRDDGKGLDPEKLRAKGIERGLIAADDPLSEQQTFALILQAGFSTAEQVTDISGRGVGMDVVKRNVEKLRGKIEIESKRGEGSCFRIRLPLTLAIIDGMIVRVGTERLIIPTILIEQSLRPEPRQITSVQRRGAMLQVRGELCPMIQLGALFDYTPPVDPCGHLVVIAQCEGQKIALVVEELIGQQQVVIKTLGERFKRVHGVSGAAILGDGRVGLILEPTGLLGLHNQQGSPTYTPQSAVTEDAAAATESWCVDDRDVPKEEQVATDTSAAEAPAPALAVAVADAGPDDSAATCEESL
jgi:two-component system chemotaxis sensor kinase CheA